MFPKPETYHLPGQTGLCRQSQLRGARWYVLIFLFGGQTLLNILQITFTKIFNLQKNKICSYPDGVIVLDPGYLHDRKIFGQLVCSFRYGREEDEVMGLKFQKDLHLVSELVYPPPAKLNPNPLTKLQERLLKKLGPNGVPFTFKFPSNSPASVTLQPGPDDEGRPCGVDYFLKFFVGETESDLSHKR